MEPCIVNHVYKLRTKKRMTQEELGEAAGVTRQTIIAIEKGNYTPSVSLALRLSCVFSTTVEELFELCTS